jgi:hypothetical protein
MDDGTSDLLDRAVTAMREMRIPSGPARNIQSATLAAASRRRPPQSTHGLRSVVTAPIVARAAVLACLAAGAAAAYFAVMRLHNDPSGQQIVRQTPFSHPVGPNTVGASGVSAGAMITGEIRFEGNAPPPRLIDFGPAAQRYNQPMYDDSLLVNLDDTVQNVVVSVVSGLPERKHYPEPTTPVYLDQSSYTFEPHVLAMRTGQPILLRNSDPVPHNTHSLSVRNPSFSIVQSSPDAGTALPSPREPEIFQVQCDIHPWMKSWLCAFDHPYFNVSLANGTFTLHGLAPGHYRLRAWHERLGTQERDVVVRPGQDETINFVFSLPPAPKSPQAAVPKPLGRLVSILS